MVADGGVGAVGTVGKEHQGVFVDIHGLGLTLFRVLDAGGHLPGVVDVEDHIGAAGVEHEVDAMIPEIFDHGQDHGFILIVLGEFQRLQLGQAADVVDEAVDILFDLQGAVLVLEGKHSPPVPPEVGVEHLVGPDLIDGLAVQILVLHKEQLHDLHAGLIRQAEEPVGVGVLAPLLGDAAEGIVGVMLVEPVVLIQNGDLGIFDGGDAAEQIPQTFKVVLHLPAAPDDKALVNVQNTVAGAAGHRHVLHDGDVFAGHLGVAHQEAGGRKSRQSCADHHCPLFLNALGFLWMGKCLVVAVAVIHVFSSPDQFIVLRMRSA